MEEYNKKTIIIVFSGLLVTFVFLYKGIILSGDEYYKEYMKYSNYDSQLIKTTSLKSTKINTGIFEKPKEKEKKKINTTKILNVIENL